VLLLKPNCECCDRDLPGTSTEAMICSFECTFCRSCATGRLDSTCPNCGGELQPRPTRAAALLESFPASTDRAALVGACTPVEEPA
jgi:hypothetical protein